MTESHQHVVYPHIVREPSNGQGVAALVVGILAMFFGVICLLSTGFWFAALTGAASTASL